MTKYLFNLVILFTVVPFIQTNAQDNSLKNNLCDIFWWQQFESEDVSLKTKNINLNSLSYGACRDGDTPLMVAYRAGVSDETIIGIFELTAIYAIGNLFDITNIHGESFSSVLSKEYGPGIELLLNVEVLLR